MALTKRERLRLIYTRLARSQPAATLEAIRATVHAVITEVEDAHSGEPDDHPWCRNATVRIYAPGDAQERRSPIPGTRLFRTTRQWVFYGHNGAMEFRTATSPDPEGRSFSPLDAPIELSLPGADGRSIAER